MPAIDVHFVAKNSCSVAQPMCWSVITIDCLQAWSIPIKRSIKGTDRLAWVLDMLMTYGIPRK